MRTGHFLPSSTVELALKLSDAGLADRDNAEIFGVAVNTIRRWRHVYQRLGLPRAPYNPLRLCPRCGDRDLLDEEAYAHLLGWYLGDGSLALLRRGVYVLQVDTDNAYPGLMDEIEQSMRRVKPDGSVHRTARKGCKAIKMQWKHWPCVFPQHGPGRKHNRKIALEDWQQKIVDRHSGMFLRGLFHSDGSRFVNRVHAVTRAGRQEYEYIRYYFGNKSRDILEICGAALDSLGIPWRYTRPDNLAVSRKDAVAALDKIVGPKY
jgi:hypothetical protein